LENSLHLGVLSSFFTNTRLLAFLVQSLLAKINSKAVFTYSASAKSSFSQLPRKAENLHAL